MFVSLFSQPKLENYEHNLNKYSLFLMSESKKSRESHIIYVMVLPNWGLMVPIKKKVIDLYLTITFYILPEMQNL